MIGKLLVAGFVFVLLAGVFYVVDKDDIIVEIVEDNYHGEVFSFEDRLRELDRINKLLGVSPSDLADEKTRDISQKAKDFIEKETTLREVTE